jgi:ATP-binding cassette subfamily B multidrug efflux pump
MSYHEEEALGKAYDAGLMRRLLEYFRPYKPQVAGAFAAIVGASILQLAQPYLLKVAIDRYIASGDLAGMNWIGLLFLAILIASFGLEYAQTYTMQMTGQRIMFDLRMQVYRHLQRLDLAYYDRNPVGRLMTRVTTDVDVLNDLFTSGVVAAFGDLFTLVGIMVVLIIMDWRLALVAFSVLPLIVVVTQWFRRRVRESYRTVRTWIARINAFLQENISGMATVQLFRREAANFRRFDDINQKHRDANLESIFYYAVFFPAIEVVGALASAFIIWFGGGWVMGGTLTLGSLVAFLQYSQRFFRPISDMSEKFNILQSAMASSERVFNLLDTAVVIESPAAAARRPRGARGHIVFDRVWFSYNQASTDIAGTGAGDALEYVLRDVSFEVRPGERVGIVGATGAGKTTLISLLLRFYDVSRGRILVDGVDIRELDVHELRRLIGLVLQDVHLFSGTIAGNIRLGNGAIGEDEVRRAASAAHVDRFINALPAGYDSPVAERGATLSVGQKQLLSFARALAFNPSILVLDEATSSVDTETELLIRDALHTLMAGRTTLAIAHRLSTIQDMDKILVFHKGQIRESGSHQELLARRRIYYRLYQLQYKGGEETPGAPPLASAVILPQPSA